MKHSYHTYDYYDYDGNPVDFVDENGMVHVEATLNPHPHLAPGMTAFITLEKVPGSNP